MLIHDDNVAADHDEVDDEEDDDHDNDNETRSLINTFLFLLAD